MNLTTKALEQAGIGLAITIVLTLGAALVGVGPTTNLNDWLRNLAIAEAGAVGAFVVNWARGELAPPTT